MEITAGLPVKQDVVVYISDSSEVLQLEINSSVKLLFGSAIETAATNELHRLGVKSGLVKIDDYQAFDFVIRARIKAAVNAMRNGGSDI